MSAPPPQLSLSPAARAETETYGGWCVLRQNGALLYFHAASGRLQPNRPALVPPSAPPVLDGSDADIASLIATCAARRALGRLGSPSATSLLFSSSPPRDADSALSPAPFSPLSPRTLPTATPDWRSDRDYVARETWRLLARWKSLLQLDHLHHPRADEHADDWERVGMGGGDGSVAQSVTTGTGSGMTSTDASASAGTMTTRHALEEELGGVLSGRSAAERAKAWLGLREGRIREMKEEVEKGKAAKKDEREREVRRRAEVAAQKRAKILTRIAAAKKVQRLWRIKARERWVERMKSDPAAHQSAIRLQAAMRGYRARQQLRKTIAFER